MSEFKIDFFELAFLAEACIPPRPIARTMFWQSLTDQYWQQMTEGERAHLFEWLNKNEMYRQSLENNIDTQVFHARFDPENQYEVLTSEEEKIRAFKMGDRYYVGTNRWVAEGHVTSVEKFVPKREY